MTDIDLKTKIPEFLERFPFYKYAAKAYGISEDTLKRMRDDDKEFADRCEASRVQGLIKYANKANPEFMLASAEPETFGKKNNDDGGDKKPLVIIKDGGKTIEVAN